MFGAASRAQIEGPALFLSANAVQNIGFALHELATNASKHGALTAPQGRVLVSWRGPEPDDRIHLEWIERDGPAVQSSLRQGFGYLVLTELVAQSLQGTAKLDLAPSGIQWRLDIPATHALSCARNNDANDDMISLATYPIPAQLWLAAAAAQGGDAPDEQGDQPDVEARSLRVLIVEDEFFISLDTKRLLQNLGHVAVAVAVSADQAVNIAERERPDVVLMDIRLDRHPRRDRCRR